MSKLFSTGRTKGPSGRHKPYSTRCFCKPRHPAWVSCDSWEATFRRVLKADGITLPKGLSLQELSARSEQ